MLPGVETLFAGEEEAFTAGAQLPDIDLVGGGVVDEQHGGVPRSIPAQGHQHLHRYRIHKYTRVVCPNFGQFSFEIVSNGDLLFSLHAYIIYKVRNSRMTKLGQLRVSNVRAIYRP